MLKKIIIILLLNTIFTQTAMLSSGGEIGIWFESDLFTILTFDEEWLDDFVLDDNELLGGDRYEPEYAIKVDYLTKKAIEVGGRYWIGRDTNLDIFANFHSKKGIGKNNWYAGLEMPYFFDGGSPIANVGIYELDSFGDFSLRYHTSTGNISFKITRFFELQTIFMGVEFNINSDDITMGLNIGNFINKK